MPTNYTSPYATSFKSALNRGTSYSTAVYNIAKRYNKTPDYVWQSLYKANLCYRQKFNGQWIYWPVNVKKANAKNCKVSQYNAWQWYCEWFLMNGCCTPDQLKKHVGSQKDFMTWCKKFFGKQYTWTNTKKRTTKTTRTNKTKRTAKRKTTRKVGYKFPRAKSRTTRRYRKAA